jgi:hypothetical protein
MATLDYTKFIGDRGRVLGEEEISSIFERKIYSEVTFAIEEQSLRGKLMKDDHTTESYATDTLDLVEWPDDMAFYGGGELNAYPATIGEAETTEIKTQYCGAKAVYGEKAEFNPDFNASKDIQAMQQIIKRENYELVNGVYSNKSNAVGAKTASFLCFDDVLALAAQIGGNGGSMTHILMHWDEWQLLLADPEMRSREKTTTMRQIDRAEAQFWDIPEFGWLICVSRHATSGTIVAWDFNRFMTEAFSLPMQAAPFDERTGGRGTKVGTFWYFRFGVGTNVNGSDFVAYMTP